MPPTANSTDLHAPAKRDAASATDAANTRALRAAGKGEQTRQLILDAALALATDLGLEGISIGAVAEAAHMSKSGVFAHFGSREELQLSVVRAYHARFEAEVFAPALKRPRGLPRLRELFARWIQHTSTEVRSGCIYISGAVEFDDRAGCVRDELVASIQSWLGAIQKAIELTVTAGHFKADTNAQQVVFDMHGLILALHLEARFLKNPTAPSKAWVGFERIVNQCMPLEPDG
jgi:AcrR family transcriptional regulator